jgi:hypothetical protein
MRNSAAALRRSQFSPAAQNQHSVNGTRITVRASQQTFVRFLVSPLLVLHPSQSPCMRGISSNRRNARAAHVEGQSGQCKWGTVCLSLEAPRFLLLTAWDCSSDRRSASSHNPLRIAKTDHSCPDGRSSADYIPDSGGSRRLPINPQPSPHSDCL